MRVLGASNDNENYNRDSKVFQKKIVSGRVQLVDTQLTEENIKLHEKQYRPPGEEEQSEPKTEDFNEYFVTEPGAQMPLGLQGKKNTPREQSGQGNTIEANPLAGQPSQQRTKTDQSVAGSKVFTKPMIGRKNK